MLFEARHSGSESLFLPVINEVKLEQVKHGSVFVMGSDNYLDQIMNFRNEHSALQSFKTTFHQLGGDPRLFPGLVSQWLWEQHMFYLAEHGCGRYLQIQPTYRWQLNQIDSQLKMSPVGLAQFGDQSRRFTQVDQRVGEGLQQAYHQLYRQGPNTWVGIMSGTELYQQWNSETDVINLMRAVNKDTAGAVICEGKYVVLNRVLSSPERRFVYNLFAILSHGFSIDHFISRSCAELAELIPSDRLWSTAKAGPEYRQMVEEPPVFQDAGHDSEDPLYAFVTKLNHIFKQRFAVPLITDADISMYPQIKQMATDYLPSLFNAIWLNPDQNKYYDQVRKMGYACQQIWARRQGFSRQETDDYISGIMAGSIPIGFEISFTGPDLAWNQAGLNPLSHWQQPLQIPGYEGNQYCEQHRMYYDGIHCPECKKTLKKTIHIH